MKMATKKGKIIAKEGKHFLEMDGKSTEINTKALSNPSAITNLAGKNVDVELSDGAKPFVVSITEAQAAAPKAAAAPSKAAASSKAKPTTGIGTTVSFGAALASNLKPFGILCYLPPAELISAATLAQHQPVLAQNLVKEGLISKKLGDKLTAVKM